MSKKTRDADGDRSRGDAIAARWRAAGYKVVHDPEGDTTWVPMPPRGSGELNPVAGSSGRLDFLWNIHSIVGLITESARTPGTQTLGIARRSEEARGRSPPPKRSPPIQSSLPRRPYASGRGGLVRRRQIFIAIAHAPAARRRPHGVGAVAARTRRAHLSRAPTSLTTSFRLRNPKRPSYGTRSSRSAPSSTTCLRRLACGFSVRPSWTEDERRAVDRGAGAVRARAADVAEESGNGSRQPARRGVQVRASIVRLSANCCSF